MGVFAVADGLACGSDPLALAGSRAVVRRHGTRRGVVAGAAPRMISKVEGLNGQLLSISFQAESQREAEAMKLLWHNSDPVRSGDKVTVSVYLPLARHRVRKAKK